MKKNILIYLLLPITALFCQCDQRQASSANTRADEAALIKADSGWSAATGAKNVAGFNSFLIDDVVGMVPNAPVQNGKDAFTGMMKNFFAIPGFFVKWNVTKATIANSGDLGYTYGAYHLELNDSTGKKINDTGKYTTIWKKQNDGSWKVAVDIFNSDLPAHQ